VSIEAGTSEGCRYDAAVSHGFPNGREREVDRASIEDAVRVGFNNYVNFEGMGMTTPFGPTVMV